MTHAEEAGQEHRSLEGKDLVKLAYCCGEDFPGCKENAVGRVPLGLTYCSYYYQVENKLHPTLCWMAAIKVVVVDV